MSRFIGTLVVAAGFLLAPLGASPVPKEKPKPKDGPNSNAILKKHKETMKVSASSEWGGWPASHAFDGNQETSWYSATNDCKSAKKDPSLEVLFPEDVAVTRVTVLGNRDPAYPTGYFSLAGQLELLDKDGKVLARIKKEATGEKKDYDFVLSDSFGRVRTLQFVSTDDDSAHGGWACTAIAEIQVE